MTLDEALTRYAGAVAYRPGDTEALNARILALIRTGRKTMSCDAWTRAEADGLPVLGRVDIALAWEGRPAVATRTLKVESIRFDEMDEARVGPQGEFRDLVDWQEGYRQFLTRTGGFAPDMELMVETFELVEDFLPGGSA